MDCSAQTSKNYLVRARQLVSYTILVIHGNALLDNYFLFAVATRSTSTFLLLHPVGVWQNSVETPQQFPDPQ